MKKKVKPNFKTSITSNFKGVTTSTNKKIKLVKDFKREDICTNCKKRKATLNWVGEGSIMDFVHGNFTRWCKVCAVRAELKHAKKQVRRIPSLEKKLNKLKNK